MTPSPRARRGRLATVAGLSVVVLAACGGTAGTTAGSGGASGNRTLTIQGDAGNPTLVENFNPFQYATQLHGTYLLYEPLEIPSPIDGTYTPFLATGHAFRGPTTLVYTIRTGVRWSDGTALTPADVVFTFELLKKYPALDGKGVWQQVRAVSATGNDVTITLSSPNVPFAATIAQTPIVPEHIWKTVTDPVASTNIHPIGSGPFTLDAFAPTQYSLKKNPTYWQAAKIAPSEVLFPAQSSNQSTNQLDVTSGSFDWAYNYLPDVKNVYVAKAPKTNAYWFPPGGAIGLFLNLTKAPYSDVNFRKGVSLSLNRTTIATKAVGGYLDQASQSGLILPNLEKWLDPALPDRGNVTASATAATASFAQAGYTSQGGRLVGKDGKQATMTIVMPGNFSDWVAAAKEVVNELGAAGIKVSLELPQYAQYSQSIQAGTFDAALGGFGGTGDPYSDFNTALNGAFATAVNTPTVNNFERFKSPTVDAALAALAAATEPAAQQKATYTLEEVMYQQVPVVLLYHGGSWGLFSTKNFTGWPSAADPYTLPTNYNGGLLTVLTHLTRS